MFLNAVEVCEVYVAVTTLCLLCEKVQIVQKKSFVFRTFAKSLGGIRVCLSDDIEPYQRLS